MNEKWYKDLMSQTFQSDNFTDPTRLLIVYSMLIEGCRHTYSLFSISRNVYRLYLSNAKLAKNNINLVVRNIDKYGVEDLIPIVSYSLAQWMREQKNSSLKYDKEFIYWNLDEYDDKTIEMTKKMCDVLFKKYFKCECFPIESIDYIAEYDDKDIDLFGNSLLKNRIIESYQYCPLTEETDLSLLRVVHIVPKSENSTLESLTDSANAVMLRKDLCIDYNNGLFYFDEFGRIILNGSTLVSRRMRLSQKIISNDMKKYLLIHFENMQRKD